MGHYDIKRGGYDVFFVTNAHLRHKVEEDALTNKTAREQAIEKIIQILKTYLIQPSEGYSSSNIKYWRETREFVANKILKEIEALGYVQKDQGQTECIRCGGTGYVKDFGWHGVDELRHLEEYQIPCPICHGAGWVKAKKE